MAASEIDFGLLTGDGITTRSAKAGEIIFKEGDEAHQLFVIKSGFSRATERLPSFPPITYLARWR
jgi:CRP-like cAMP-binding protein